MSSTLPGSQSSTSAAHYTRSSTVIRTGNKSQHTCLVLHRSEDGAVNFRSADCPLQLNYICKRSITITGKLEKLNVETSRYLTTHIFSLVLFWVTTLLPLCSRSILYLCWETASFFRWSGILFTNPFGNTKGFCTAQIFRPKDGLPLAYNNFWNIPWVDGMKQWCGRRWPMMSLDSGYLSVVLINTVGPWWITTFVSALDNHYRKSWSVDNTRHCFLQNSSRTSIVVNWYTSRGEQCWW